MLAIKNNRVIVFLIALIAALIFIPFIGNCPLFDWDEVNFAECAREMVVSGNYSRVQLNYQPFWEKPPFFIWLQALSMNVFGINEFAARFPNALCSIISLITLFHIGKNYHSVRFGIVWVIIYVSTLLPHFYFKSGIIDPWFNLFIFLSIYQCILFFHKSSTKHTFLNAVLGGFFLGLAVLTKGPAAVLIVALTLLVFLTWNKQLKLLFTSRFIIFILTTLVVSGTWFLVEWLKGNEQIIIEFIEYQFRLLETEDSGHSGSFAYHFIVLLLGCFPASFLFILTYLRYNELNEIQKNYRKMILSLFWVVLIVFSIVQTKIIHYSSLCYFPLSFVATIGIVQQQKTIKFKWLSGIFYFLITLVISSAFIALGFTEQLKPFIIQGNFIEDEFAIHALSSKVHWSGFEFMLGFVYLAGALLIFYAIQKQRIRLFYLGAFMNTLFISFAILVIVPKIEGYTQHATIDFYKNCASQNCYIETRGFKSYAYLFYSQRKPDDYVNPDQIKSIKKTLDEMEKDGHSRVKSYALANLLWLENGKIDRPAYFVAKTIHEKDVFLNENIAKLYDLNGYSFFVRIPDKTAK